MKAPDRPKRPSARPTTRPEQLAATSANVVLAQPGVPAQTDASAQPAAVVVPAQLEAERATPSVAAPAAASERAANAKPAERAPRVSARRSAPAGTPLAAGAPRVRPEAAGRSAKGKPATVHTAPTVVPKTGAAKTAIAARRDPKKSGKNPQKSAHAASPVPAQGVPTSAVGAPGRPTVPAPAQPATLAPSALASAALADSAKPDSAQSDSAQSSRPAFAAQSAASSGAADAPVAAPATERPSKGRASRASRPELSASEPPAQPGVQAVEADETWNDEAAPAAFGAFDADDSQRGLTREISAARLLRAGQPDAAHEVAARSAAQSILATDYYARQYGAHGLRSLAVDVDEFGFDPYVEERARAPLETLVERYFRVAVEGAERVPAEGRALFVVNRAGVLPWDALVLRTVLRSQRPELPPLRWLAEDDVIHYPFLGVFMNRLGAVRACPENAERLLARDRLLAVFPEGAQGSRKPYAERYRLQRFGRGGYIRLALKLGVPIFPTAVVGAEDVHPMLGRSRLLGRIFGADSLPLTPTFPWLGALGLIPAPVKWRIVVGEPVDLSGYGPNAADDALVVHRLNEQVRGILQGLVDSARVKRGHAVFG